MSMLDGLAEEALEDFGDDFRDGVLSIPGERGSDGQGGQIDLLPPTVHPCKALVTDYSDYRRLTLGIPGADRQILVLGASLPAGVVPAKGHSITAPDPSNGGVPRSFEIIAKAGDSASAVYRLQGR